jgi:hypothetical protein
VRIVRGPQFDDERQQFRLQLCCEECGHFDVRSGTCAHEWPTALHRRARQQAETREVDFCKEFELC